VGLGCLDDGDCLLDVLEGFAPDEGGVSEFVDFHGLDNVKSTLPGELVSSLNNLVESSTSASRSYLPT
jgi:hypothetical protein